MTACAGCAGRLRKPSVLQAQVDRLLADSKAEALITDFANQRLKIYEFDRFPPDDYIYRDNYYSAQFGGNAADMEEEAFAVGIRSRIDRMSENCQNPSGTGISPLKLTTLVRSRVLGIC